MNIFGKVSTMTRRIVTNFEDTVEVTSPPEYLQQTAQRKSIYNKSVSQRGMGGRSRRRNQ